MGNKISLTRGDTAFISIEMKNRDGTSYVMKEGDQVIFTCKESTYSPGILFQKALRPDGTIEISPEDTRHLPYGDYVYDCELRRYGGEVQTFIPPSLFTVCEEVTFP